MKTVVIPPPGDGNAEQTDDKGPTEEAAPVPPVTIPAVPVPPTLEEPASVGDNNSEEVSGGGNNSEAEFVPPVAPAPPADDIVKHNGPEVTSDSVPNGEDIIPPAPEPEIVTEKKEKVPGDLEEGEIE